MHEAGVRPCCSILEYVISLGTRSIFSAYRPSSTALSVKWWRTDRLFALTTSSCSASMLRTALARATQPARNAVLATVRSAAPFSTAPISAASGGLWDLAGSSDSGGSNASTSASSSGGAVDDVIIPSAGILEAPSLPGSGADPHDWSRSFHGLSAESFSKEVSDVLLAPLDPRDVEVKPGT